MSSPSAQTSPPSTPTPPAKTSPIRMAVLLGVLALVMVMLLVDQFMFKPAVAKAQADLAKAAEEKMRMGVSDGVPASANKEHYLTADDVYKIVGRKSSWEVSEGPTVVQTFAWWGIIPLNRQRFDVQFTKSDDGTLRYVTHDGHIPLEDAKRQQTVEHVEQPVRPDPVSTEGAKPAAGTEEVKPSPDRPTDSETDPAPTGAKPDPSNPPATEPDEGNPTPPDEGTTAEPTK